MDILILLTALALSYAVYRQNHSNTTEYNMVLYEKKGQAKLPPGYNPYILNQFQEMKDRIFSADIRENRIETKPSIHATGVYGITENQIKLHPSDAITVIYGPKHTLNV